MKHKEFNHLQQRITILGPTKHLKNYLNGLGLKPAVFLLTALSLSVFASNANAQFGKIKPPKNNVFERIDRELVNFDKGRTDLFRQHPVRFRGAIQKLEWPHLPNGQYFYRKGNIVQERNPKHQPLFTFRLYHQDDGFHYIFDKSRKMSIAIPRKSGRAFMDTGRGWKSWQNVVYK